MKDLEPRGYRRRVLEALALLWAVSFAAHEIVLWLTPVAPLIIVVAVLVAVGSVVFGRRRK